MAESRQTYHINDEGKAGKCTAKIKCEFAQNRRDNKTSNPLEGLHGPKSYVDGVVADYERQTKPKTRMSSLSKTKPSSGGDGASQTVYSSPGRPYTLEDINGLHLDEIPDTILPDTDDCTGVYDAPVNNGEISEFVSGLDTVLGKNVTWGEGYEPYGVKVADAWLYRVQDHDDDGNVTGAFIVIDRNGIVTKTPVKDLEGARNELMDEMGESAALKNELNLAKSVRHDKIERGTKQREDDVRVRAAEKAAANDRFKKGSGSYLYPGFQKMAMLTRACSKNAVKENLTGDSADKSDITVLMKNGESYGISMKSFDFQGTGPALFSAANCGEGALKYDPPSDEYLKTTLRKRALDEYARHRKDYDKAVERFLDDNPLIERRLDAQVKKLNADRAKEGLRPLDRNMALSSPNFRAELESKRLLDSEGDNPYRLLDRYGSMMQDSRYEIRLIDNDPESAKHYYYDKALRESTASKTEDGKNATEGSAGFLKEADKTLTKYGFKRNDSAFVLTQLRQYERAGSSITKKQYDRLKNGENAELTTDQQSWLNAKTARDNIYKITKADTPERQAKVNKELGRAYFEIATGTFKLDREDNPTMWALTQRLGNDMVLSNEYNPEKRSDSCAFGVTRGHRTTNAAGQPSYSLTTDMRMFKDRKNADGTVDTCEDQWLDMVKGRLAFSSSAYQSSDTAKNKSKIYANRNLSREQGFAGEYCLSANVSCRFTVTDKNEKTINTGHKIREDKY